MTARDVVRAASYQRYGVLLVGGGLALIAVAWAWAGTWWAIALAAAVAAKPIVFGVEVLGRLPRKLRATRLAERRIASGRFRVASLAPYVGDPCLRVVAREILARAGYGRAERRRIVAELAAEARRGDRQVFVFEPQREG